MTRTTCALLAAVALTVAVVRLPEGAPFYDALSLLLVLAALAVALAGASLPWRPAREMARMPIFYLALGCFTVAELCALYRTPPSVYGLDEPLTWPARLGVVLIGLLVLSYAWQRVPGGRWRFPVVLLVYGLLSIGLVRSWPRPGIDVWRLQEDAASHLLHGENPYAAEYPNPYQDEEFFGPEILKGGRIQSFPYPPLSLLLVVPGHLIGDVRWSLLAAVLTAAALMVAAGRRLGLRPGDPAELAIIAFLCHPRGWFVLEMGWTEPLLLLAVSAGVWAMAAGRGRLSGLALVMVVTLKQYGMLWMPPAWASRRLRWRDLLAGIVCAGLVVVPFILWGPAAFWRGVVGFHLHSPFREDSLSVLAAVKRSTGYQLSAAWGFAAAGAAAWVVLRGPARGVSHAVLGGAAVLLAFFAFNKAAHLNYYWLAGALLALAVSTAAAQAQTRADGVDRA